MTAAEIAPEPQQPRLRQHDITIERVTTMLATAAPKGLLVVRMSCRDGAIDRIQE